MDWSEFKDVDLDSHEVNEESEALESARTPGTFTSFDDLVDAQGSLRKPLANVAAKQSFETKATTFPNSSCTSSSHEKLRGKTHRAVEKVARSASITPHYIAPLGEGKFDLSETVRMYFSNPIWTYHPDLELECPLPNPLLIDDGIISIPDIMVTPPSPGPSIAISPIPSIYIHAPAENDDSQAIIAETYCKQRKWPDVRRLSAWPKTLLHKRIQLELRWRELQRWQFENRTEAFRLMRELDFELGEIMDGIFESMENGDVRNPKLICADAQWALTHLRYLNPVSKNLRPLDDIVLMLSEHAHSRAKQVMKSEARDTAPDPVWNLRWHAQALPENAGPEIDSCNLLSIAELCDMDIAFPLQCSSFHLRQAQAKFRAWSEIIVADPDDRDYHMLTFTQKVTLTVLENQTKAVAGIERSKNRYLALVRLGGFCPEQMDEICEQMLFQSKTGQTSTLIAGLQLGRITKQIAAMYRTFQDLLNAKSGLTSTRSSLSKVLKGLSKHRLFCQNMKVRVHANSRSSLHAHHTRKIVDLFWKAACSARQVVFEVHKPYQQSLKRCSEIERLLWLKWVNGMYREVLVVREFKRKIHLSLLPSVDDFVYETLAWWEAKLDEAARSACSQTRSENTEVECQSN